MNMNKKVKIISIFLAAIMFISVIVVSADVFILTPSAEKAEKPLADSGDEQIACDISNITGVRTEALLSERSKGKAWDDILEELRSGYYEKGTSKGQRDNTLSLSGIGQSELDKLKKEGFEDQEIQQARMLVERAAFQLQEITGNNTETDNVPDMNISAAKKDDIELYREIISKFDLVICLNLILKLQDDFGSMEKALDEYLFCLQAGMDLALYIADKEEYLRLREEKSALINPGDTVTIAKIEEKMLDSLRKSNEAETDTGTGKIDDVSGIASNEAANSQDNDVPSPTADIINRLDVSPENPADSIKREIDILDPMKTVEGGLNQ